MVVEALKSTATDWCGTARLYNGSRRLAALGDMLRAIATAVLMTMLPKLPSWWLAKLHHSCLNDASEGKDCPWL